MNSVETSDKVNEPSMNQGQTGQAVVPPYAWVILVVVFIASIAAPLAQFKVSPVMPLLLKAYNLNMTSAGALMSVFAITGFILALPAGLILHKLGLKVTGLIAMGCLVVGSAWGAVSTTSVSLMSSRFVEGVGMGLIAVTAPAAIAMWFPAEKRGLPMGIWNTWMPVGALLAFGVIPSLATRFGFQSAWWFSGAIGLLAFLLVGLFMRMPAAMTARPEDGGPPPGEEELSMRKALSNRSIWLLAGCGCIFGIGAMIIPTFYVTFLSQLRGYTIQKASFYLTLTQIVALFAAPLVGVLLDRIGSRKALIIWPFIMLAILFVFPFNITGVLIPLWLIVYTLCSSAIPTAMFTAAPEIMGKPQLAGLGMGAVSMGQNFGMFVGPMLFGALVESFGWSSAGYGAIPILVLGSVIGYLVKVR
jgi:predicted MFS family arabinose efflux permease